jgi:hypothetical protein
MLNRCDLLILVTAATLSVGAVDARQPTTLRPQLTERVGLTEFDLDGNGTWTVRNGTLALEKAGVPHGPIRRPAALAILKSEPLKDLTFSAELRSTAPVDLAVRDVQLIVGYQSPSQFYYVHLAAKTDAVHNGIFLVNNADRRRIDEPTSRARLVDQAWHRVRLERNVTTGSIVVFVDDDKTPALSATDRTLTSGRVGVGSFDETGEFRAIEVTARK